MADRLLFSFFPLLIIPISIQISLLETHALRANSIAPFGIQTSCEGGIYCVCFTTVCMIAWTIGFGDSPPHSPNSQTLLTYLLTAWWKVLLEKLTGLQLVKKFPTFHGTRRFITALTSVRHLSLSWASPTQSIYTHPTSWRSVLVMVVRDWWCTAGHGVDWLEVRGGIAAAATGSDER